MEEGIRRERATGRTNRRDRKHVVEKGDDEITKT
jgi:hypothetical protein